MMPPLFVVFVPLAFFAAVVGSIALVLLRNRPRELPAPPRELPSSSTTVALDVAVRRKLSDDLAAEVERRVLAPSPAERAEERRRYEAEQKRKRDEADEESRRRRWQTWPQSTQDAPPAWIGDPAAPYVPPTSQPSHDPFPTSHVHDHVSHVISSGADWSGGGGSFDGGGASASFDSGSSCSCDSGGGGGGGCD